MTTNRGNELAVLHFEYNPNPGRGSSSRSRSRPLLQVLRPSSHNDPSTLTSSSAFASISARRPPDYPGIGSHIQPPAFLLASITASSPSTPNSPNCSQSSIPAGTILPVGLKSGLHPRQYLWDGHRLVAIELQDLEQVAASASQAASNATNNNKNSSSTTQNGPFQHFPLVSLFSQKRNRVLVPLPSLSGAVARWF